MAKFGVLAAVLLLLSTASALPVEVREATLQNVHKLAVGILVLTAGTFLMVLLMTVAVFYLCICPRQSGSNTIVVSGSDRRRLQDF